MLYLDNAATTPMSLPVCKAMWQYMINDYGNPSSIYECGRNNKRAVEEARANIAGLIGTEADNIYFTSGGTESDNWALEAAVAGKHGGTIIVSGIEHPAILNKCRDLEKRGYNIEYLRCTSDDIIDIEDLRRKIKDDTLLISVMLVNNEIGTIQPLMQVSAVASEYGIPVHTDAVAAFGHIDIDVHKLGVSMLSVSAHKICGPKGVGFLYTDRELEPLIYGGGQEKNMRSGTENVAGIIGLATAADIAVNTLHYRMEKEWNIQRYMAERIVNEIPYTSINGNMTGRVSGNINICFKGISAGELVLLLDKQGICVSSGSACHGNHGGPSHVLKAIGKTDEESLASIRLTFNHTLNRNQADYCIDCIKKNVAALREIKND